MVFVRDGDVELPVVVFLDEFASSDTLVIVTERVRNVFEVSGTAAEDAFDVVVGF